MNLDIDSLIDHWLAGNYPGFVAILIFLLLDAFKRFRLDTWEAIPVNYRWAVPVLMGSIAGFAESLAGGLGFAAAALGAGKGFVEGLLAIGLYKMQPSKKENPDA